MSTLLSQSPAHPAPLSGIEARSAEAEDRAKEGVELRAAEMEGVFAAISASILVFNCELRVTRANPAAERLLGFDPAGLDCETIAERLQLRNLDGTPLDPAKLPSHCALAGHSASGRYVALRNGVERFIVDAVAEPLRIHGEIAGAVVLWRDVTERERLIEELARSNAALAEADRRKNEFLGVLSHELRNPLAPIRNSIYLLDHVPGDSLEATSAKRIIRRQMGHLTRIVDDLLDVTRISRGKIELDRKRFDLRELVLRTCEDHRSMFDQGRVELRHDLPAGPVWVDADATRIAQVLGNLLQNAAKFTTTGVVSVGVAARDARAEMSVRDTGAGMRPEDVDTMFEPFAQAEQGLARTQGGLGLGLALVKGLVELHGGSVRARSDGPGHGAEFVVLLPLAPAPAPRWGTPSKVEAAGGRLVLIIDDNVDTCASLSAVLGLVGHRVRTACDGKTGIDAARALKPDVVLCDIGLPDMDGYHVARTLREDEALSSTRLIALSGYARPEDTKRAREAGFDSHIAKPPDPEALTEMLGD